MKKQIQSHPYVRYTRNPVTVTVARKGDNVGRGAKGRFGVPCSPVYMPYRLAKNTFQNICCSHFLAIVGDGVIFLRENFCYVSLIVLLKKLRYLLRAPNP